VFDRVCGKEPLPWLDRFRAQRRKLVAHHDADRQAAQRPETRPERALAAYAGDYDHPGYGRITITQTEGALHWAFRGMAETLVHRDRDTFELPESPESPGQLLPGRLAVAFSAGGDGNIASLAVPFEPLVAAIVFSRVR